MFSDSSGHGGLPFFDTAVARKQTLADTGYLGIPWRRVGSGAESVGDMVFGRPCGYHDDDDDDEESNHGGCEFNGYESCDGDCPNCDYYHGGCENNGWEQCDGECSECSYGDTLENKYDDMVVENSQAAYNSAKPGIFGGCASLGQATSKKFTREEEEI